MKKRTVALLCAAVMLLGVVFGGTMALLSHNSKPLTNSFEAANISLKLTETTGGNYIMAPGAVLMKDPTVAVDENSADCWLFVKVDERNNAEVGSAGKPVLWEPAEGWEKVTLDGETVYRKAYQKGEERNIPFLKNNQVVINSELTSEYLKKLPENQRPKLSFTVYGIQQKNLEGKTDVEIWNLAKAGADLTLAVSSEQTDTNAYKAKA